MYPLMDTEKKKKKKHGNPIYNYWSIHFYSSMCKQASKIAILCFDLCSTLFFLISPHLPYTQQIEHWAIECPCTWIKMIYTCVHNVSACVFGSPYVAQIKLFVVHVAILRKREVILKSINMGFKVYVPSMYGPTNVAHPIVILRSINKLKIHIYNKVKLNILIHYLFL